MTETLSPAGKEMAKSLTTLKVHCSTSPLNREGSASTDCDSVRIEEPAGGRGGGVTDGSGIIFSGASGTDSQQPILLLCDSGGVY